MQAVAATLFLLMAQLGESVRAGYQIMVDMMLIVTFIPFIYIFCAGFRFASRIAAMSGLAVTFVGEWDGDKLPPIQKLVGNRLQRKLLPIYERR